MIFAEHPLSLQSICRLSIRNYIGPHRIRQIKTLSLNEDESSFTGVGIGLAPHLMNFLEYRQLFLSTGQLPDTINWDTVAHATVIKRLSKVLDEVST